LYFIISFDFIFIATINILFFILHIILIMKIITVYILLFFHLLNFHNLTLISFYFMNIIILMIFLFNLVYQQILILIIGIIYGQLD
jgi:hypothetical protein